MAIALSYLCFPSLEQANGDSPRRQTAAPEPCLADHPPKWEPLLLPTPTTAKDFEHYWNHVKRLA